MAEAPAPLYTALKTKKPFLVGGSQVLKPNLTYIFSTKTLEGLRQNADFSKSIRCDADFFSQQFKPFNPDQLPTYKNVLVFRSGGIGDLVFSYPVLAKIKQVNPTCKITYVTQQSNLDLVRSFAGSLVDTAVSLPLLGQDLQRSDAHIVFEGLIETSPLAEQLDAYDLFYRHVFPEAAIQESLLPQFTLDEGLQREIVSRLPRNLVLIHARSSSLFRNIPKEIWIELVGELLADGFPVGFIDSASSSAALDKFIAANFGQHATPVHNLAPLATTIRHTLEICRASALVIGVDSSVINLAAALGRPSIGLYTCFPGKLRLSHFPKARIIQSTYNGCGIAPCFHHVDGPKCIDVRDGKVAGCISGFVPAEILAQARSLLGAEQAI